MRSRQGWNLVHYKAVSQLDRLKDGPYKGPKVRGPYGPLDGPFERVFGEAFVGKVRKSDARVPLACVSRSLGKYVITRFHRSHI